MDVERNEISPEIIENFSLETHPFLSYLKLARPDHWFKNFFILPGFLVAYFFSTQHLQTFFLNLFYACLSVCLISSANYILNEWLDKEFDKFHPTKKQRPCVANSLNPFYVAVEYSVCCSVGLALAAMINSYYFAASLSLLMMGIVYNVLPLRSKDIAYLDVLSESINNPIRLLLGWFIVTNATLPPSSLLLAYWMGGAFLMSVKRFSEYRFIGNPSVAGLYRRSFVFYTEKKLLVASVFYAVCSAFFSAIFVMKYKIELVLAFPFYALLFSWYFSIGFKADSAAQRPESMYKEKYFLLFVLFVIVFSGVLFVSHLPWIGVLKIPIFGAS